VTLDIALIFFILVVSVVLLIFEWIPMEVTALLTLGAVALTGLVKPVEALFGFSSPAVVTVWAVFILSGGLIRTGVANIIGQLVLKMAGRKETTMIIVIMTSAGVMSAVMNNVAVAAMMMPIVMDVARHTGTPPSRLLMPLAYGSLLGGLTTQIGTPPNILVSVALRDAGLKPFGFFDFTPVGLAVMGAGILFMTFVGRHLLPDRDVAKETFSGRKSDWQKQYALHERLFQVRIPEKSALINKTLAESRIGSALGLTVLGITRSDKTMSSPNSSERLLSGDLLTIGGSGEDINRFHGWRQLTVEADSVDIVEVYSKDVKLAEVRLPTNCGLIDKTLNFIGFRERYAANVLAIRRNDTIKRTNLQDFELRHDDRLLLAGQAEKLEALQKDPDFDTFRYVSRDEVTDVYHLSERLLLLRVTEGSALVGKTLKETRLGGATGGHIRGIMRGNNPIVMPEPWEVLQAEDRLIVEGGTADFETLKGLEDLVVEPRMQPDIEALVPENFGLVEAVLSPHTTLEGKTLRQLNFREKFGLNVVAIWHKGSAQYSDLRDTALIFGDALLLFGPREKLQVLGQEPDFIVLTETAQEAPRIQKAKLSLAVLLAVLFPVVMGWVPIYIAAVVGAALMVLTGCLTMDEAYRQIEWKAVFLIAGMLPLGTALDKTGAAKLIAEGVVSVVGPYGPVAIMGGLIAMTFLATCFVPTAALVVLMAPIVMNTSADMGLSPYGLMMAIALAASASFTTPFAHPANILVMGPGGYRFFDYLKIGGLMTLTVFVVLMVFLQIFWPLT
jgi:di/tricarboxylate transporter